MKLSETPSKIIGVTLGEVTLNLMTGGYPLKAKFALVTKEGDLTGFMEIAADWPPNILEALQVFIGALEETALQRITDHTPSEAKPETPTGPQQF